ncbi:MAG: hypothetical protein LBR49_00580 [Tannerella sp.]|jgi:ABC-type phosphate transport system substrate-binding protein|nr:hypothetical protein [Tannerella sp.]
MKKLFIKTVLFGVLTYVSGSAFAQEIQIEDVKFVYPIIEKWVNEYKKAYPDSKLVVKVQSGQQENNVSGVQVVASSVPELEAGGNGKVVYVGRYALIPVSNRNNPLLEKVGKGLKKKELRNLVFEKDLSDEELYEDEGKEKYTATVYSRSGQTPTTLVLAEYFDRSPERIKGKKIVGDEIYLVDALRKDENGVAFNTLNYVYDLKTRQLKSNLTVLPLNLKSEIREALLSHDIDRTISALEVTKIEAIPVENFGLVIPEPYFSDTEVLRFANWVLESGQQFNHELGFLTLDANTLSSQQKALKSERLSYALTK